MHVPPWLLFARCSQGQPSRVHELGELCDAALCSGDTSLAGERPDWWWTGAKPVAGAPGVLPDGTITSLPVPSLANCTRQQVLDYFTNRLARHSEEYCSWGSAVWGRSRLSLCEGQF